VHPKFVISSAYSQVPTSPLCSTKFASVRPHSLNSSRKRLFPLQFLSRDQVSAYGLLGSDAGDAGGGGTSVRVYTIHADISHPSSCLNADGLSTKPHDERMP
jgi:hypothetical protein